ncbi:MAG: Ribonuclease [Candidatus Hydrogenedentes bacterium ADurb.Bin179]|jgi:Cft2 family RNA processing exonuclease|nr:MAG: Ribonuclease [Candidatus Hydrogenedentes bacterium ADurb.Bin179]
MDGDRSIERAIPLRIQYHTMNSYSVINFSVLGGGGEVGANCFELSFNGYRLMLDCGTHPKKEGSEGLPVFDMATTPPDAYLVSHGHIDHCGAIPVLNRRFPDVPGYTTPPSRHIVERMLHNSVVVMEMLAEERGIPGYPLYDHYDVGCAMRLLHGQRFGVPFTPGDATEVEVTFVHAGHVLGGASILIRIPGHTLFYSGDISCTRQLLLAGCAHPDEVSHVDTLIIESTQGATDDDGRCDYEEETHRLGSAMRRVLKRGGSVLLPSFALGRTQEMVNIVANLQMNGEIPFVPMYTVGLGRAVYEIYDKFSSYLHPGVALRPLSSTQRLGNVWDKSVVDALLRKPCIIIATSGMMMENTPSALVAQAMVRQSHHGIFFVGYLDPDTLGYKLLHAVPGESLQFELNRDPVEIVLDDIAQYRFSAHASRSELVSIVQRLNPDHVIYVHGDPDALLWMQHNAGNGARSFVPGVGETISIEV